MKPMIFPTRNSLGERMWLCQKVDAGFSFSGYAKTPSLALEAYFKCRRFKNGVVPGFKS